MFPEPKTVTNDALDKLPMFATDQEIAVAIVGKERAAYYRQAIIPTLEPKGFPSKDALHGGRPVPQVKQFYALYFGITSGFALAKPDGPERVWIGRRAEKRIDDEERRRAAGEEVSERDPGTEDQRLLKAMAEYRAKKAGEYGAKKAR
ncbi:hypothetical protein [Mesorhizobium sp. CAU 1732]|uniref:hypothetical protein n=1 Tax=Mesorhizobium sp. CAU 1732 TaxID=3140358 RepID=UPI0032609E5D